MIEAAAQALSAFLNPAMLAMLLAGVLAGTIVGIMPGLGGTAAVALLLPFAFDMEPAPAMALLIGAVAVVHTSDTISAVLLGAPGSASAAVTMMDGHALARQGQAGRALSLAFLSSMAGGLLGAIGLTLSIPIARPIVLAFGAPELFLLTVLGISLAASLSEGSMYRGVLAALLGVALGMIGAAPNAAVYRYTFGQLYLTEGLPLVAVALGIFGIAEIASMLGPGSRIATQLSVESGWRQGIQDFVHHWRHVIRGALVGIWAGVLPGLGATAGTWMAYGQTVATTKDKSTFGKGDVRGIIAPESANNSVEAGDLIPTLLFGIPGGVPAAMLLGALLTYGIQPGPRIVTDHLDLLYTIIWSFALANILGAALCFLISPTLAKLTFVPFGFLAPALIVLMFLGAYGEAEQMGDLAVLLVLGALGWVMKQAGYPRAPLLIGYVLSQPIERYYFLTVNLYGTTSWLMRPWVIVFILILVGSIAWSIWSQVRHSRSRRQEAEVGDARTGDADTEQPDLHWSGAFDIALSAVFLFVLVEGFTFRGQARLLPILVGTLGTVLILPYTVREVRRGLAARGGEAMPHAREHGGALNFLWLLFFLVLVWLAGFIVATVISVPLLLWKARMSTRSLAIYTGALVVVLLGAGWLLDVDLYNGLFIKSLV